MSTSPSSPGKPRRRRADLADVLFRLGGTLMCVAFTGVVAQTIWVYEDRQQVGWYVWLTLAVFSTILSALGTFGTVRSYWRGW